MTKLARCLCCNGGYKRPATFAGYCQACMFCARKGGTTNSLISEYRWRQRALDRLIRWLQRRKA